MTLLWAPSIYAQETISAAPNIAEEHQADSRIAQQYQPQLLSQQQVGSMLNTVVEIPAIDDTYVCSNQPDARWGADRRSA
ncbi:MAG: hypothetical protein R2911_41280 [Caldilineaceae bacterium]